MKILDKKRIIGLALALCILPTYAQQIIDYRLSRDLLDDQQKHYISVLENQYEKESIHLVGIQVSCLDKNQFQLTLPDGRILEVFRDKNLEKVVSAQAFVGQIGQKEGSIYLLSHGDMITGRMQFEGMVYNIKPLGGGLHTFTELSISEASKCSNPQFASILDVENRTSHLETSDPSSQENSINAHANGGDDNIRVIVAYTQSVAQNEADPIGLAQKAVDLTNIGYANSDIHHRLVLAAAYETYANLDNRYQVPSVLYSQFRLNGDGVMDEIHQKRALWKADLCHLLIEGVGGVARVDTEFRPSFAFAVSNYMAVDNLTFSHEVGHNHGCYDTEKAGSSAYRGYGHPLGFFRTIMAYQEDCGRGLCNRVNEYSGPINFYYFPSTGQNYVTGSFAHNSVHAHNINGTKLANHYQTDNSESFSSLNISSEEYVDVVAKHSLRFLPGCHIQSGAQLKAHIIDNGQRVNLTTLYDLQNQYDGNHEVEAPLKNSFANFSELKAFPNPFNDHLNIQFTIAASAKCRLYIQNSTGQLISEILNQEIYDKGTYNFSFSPAQWAKGLYLAVLVKDGETQTIKILK